MKILFFNSEYPPVGGGAGNASKYLLQELSKNQNLEIDFITSSADKFREEQLSDKIRIIFLDIGKKQKNLQHQSLKDLIQYSWKAYSFGRKLKRIKKYDIALAFFGVPCGYIAMGLGLPYIISLRGSDVPFYGERFRMVDQLLFRHLSPLVWKKARCVLANSEYLKNLAAKFSPKQKIEVIPNGVDVERFQKVTPKKKQKI